MRNLLVDNVAREALNKVLAKSIVGAAGIRRDGIAVSQEFQPHSSPDEIPFRVKVVGLYARARRRTYYFRFRRQ